MASPGGRVALAGVKALNAFHPRYLHDQESSSGRVPAEQCSRMPSIARRCAAWMSNNIYWRLPRSISCVPLARRVYALEDNLRVPSGVSSLIENCKMMMRLFPELFAKNRVAPVEHYPDLLLDTLRLWRPQCRPDPTVVVPRLAALIAPTLNTPLSAQQMGVELVEGARPLCATTGLCSTTRAAACGCHLPPHRR
ncbi:MAG: circularly permuted type 2 ATP-grasp protein [Uliginosibacterium sp.]|nr:circularly permuted type 2 ATP-grasp protein [Uliginosibacterium sp.]